MATCSCPGISTIVAIGKTFAIASVPILIAGGLAPPSSSNVGMRSSARRAVSNLNANWMMLSYGSDLAHRSASCHMGVPRLASTAGGGRRGPSRRKVATTSSSLPARNSAKRRSGKSEDRCSTARGKYGGSYRTNRRIGRPAPAAWIDKSAPDEWPSRSASPPAAEMMAAISSTSRSGV